MQLSPATFSSPVDPAASSSELAAAGPGTATESGRAGGNAAAPFDQLYPDLGPGRGAVLSRPAASAPAASLAGAPAKPVLSGPGRGLLRGGFNRPHPVDRTGAKGAASADPSAMLTPANPPLDPSLPLQLPAGVAAAVPNSETVAGNPESPGLLLAALQGVALPSGKTGAGVTMSMDAEAAAAVPGVPGGSVVAVTSGLPPISGPAATGHPGSPNAENVLPAAASNSFTPGDGEKFAESGASSGRRDDSGETGALKKILNVLNKQVAEHDPALGTDVAKSTPVMPAASFSSHLPPAGSTSGLQAEAAHAPAGLPPAAEVLPAAPSDSAHRAVEAVMAAADRLGTEGQHAVNLQFSLSGADLAVRVELREGAVHATFRTDSTELRAALAHEWQAVSAGVPDHPLRMAAPVFAAKDGSAFGSPGGGNPTSQQREPGSRPATAFSADAPRIGGRTSGGTAALPAAAASTSPSTTLYFQAFA